MHDEGIVKYQCEWSRGPASPDWQIAELNRARNWLYEQQLIGVNSSGTGYGNVSRRYKEKQFIISGSSTGHLAVLTDGHYSLVTSFDLECNLVACSGPAQASSESMSHGALYNLDSGIGAVIHVHHEKMWRLFLDDVPSTDPEAHYGTPEMAREIERLYHTTDLPQKKIMVMGGHFEGLVSFGASLDEALEVLRIYYREFLGRCN